MKTFLVPAVFFAAIFMGCNSHSQTESKSVTNASDSSSVSEKNTDSNTVNLADSANQMMDKAQGKMQEAANKTKEAVKK